MKNFKEYFEESGRQNQIGQKIMLFGGPGVITLTGPEVIGVTLYSPGIWKQVEPTGAIFYMDDPDSRSCFNLHRLDGPARYLAYDHQKPDFWIHGLKLKEEEYWKQPEVILYKKIKNKEDKSTGIDLLDI
jgi:hypothetical protein